MICIKCNEKTNSRFFEAKRIEELIALKVEAKTNEQKSIRNEIRHIGFYYSDFSSKKDGYTLADFENLIISGQITIID